MRRRSYGYGAYHGRGRGSLSLKIVIGVLLVVLLGAVAALLVLEKYIVYDDSGGARLELPILQRQDGEQTEPPPLLVPVAPSAEVTEKPSLRPDVILPVSVSVTQLQDGSASEMVMAGGGTAALVEMKGENGKLSWVSGEPLAIAARVSRDEPGWNDRLMEALENEELYCIARVSCFKDHELSNADASLAIYTASGYRWLDADSNRWVSPVDERVQDYLIALCLELAELGFDEILLDNAGYPTQGKLSYIRKDEAYDVERFEEVITGFYADVAEALEGSGTALSVVVDPENFALSGQSAEVMEKLGIPWIVKDSTGKSS